MYFWCICGEEGDLNLLLLHHLEGPPQTESWDHWCALNFQENLRFCFNYCLNKTFILVWCVTTEGYFHKTWASIVLFISKIRLWFNAVMRLITERTSRINDVFTQVNVQWPHGKWRFYCSSIKENLWENWILSQHIVILEC